ncbi:hypothetical protein B0H14DRAFT_3890168 [Mycena olivaceomarginata]|nr:hypothetical protein B0H14DRAFT_3890168 [Mycena olivaceomarginata]
MDYLLKQQLLNALGRLTIDNAFHGMYPHIQISPGLQFPSTLTIAKPLPGIARPPVATTLKITLPPSALPVILNILLRHAVCGMHALPAPSTAVPLLAVPPPPLTAWAHATYSAQPHPKPGLSHGPNTFPSMPPIAHCPAPGAHRIPARLARLGRACFCTATDSLRCCPCAALAPAARRLFAGPAPAAPPPPRIAHARPAGPTSGPVLSDSPQAPYTRLPLLRPAPPPPRPFVPVNPARLRRAEAGGDAFCAVRTAPPSGGPSPVTAQITGNEDNAPAARLRDAARAQVHTAIRFRIPSLVVTLARHARVAFVLYAPGPGETYCVCRVPVGEAPAPRLRVAAQAVTSLTIAGVTSVCALVREARPPQLRAAAHSP